MVPPAGGMSMGKRLFWKYCSKDVNNWKIFRNFVRICWISLNKGSLGNWGETGFLPCMRPFGPSDELETVLNSTFWNKLLSARAPLACYHRDARMSTRWRATSRFMTHHRVPLDLWSLPTGRKKGNHFFWILQMLCQLFAIKRQLTQIFVKVALEQAILYYAILLELCFSMFLCFFCWHASCCL